MKFHYLILPNFSNIVSYSYMFAVWPHFYLCVKWVIKPCSLLTSVFVVCNTFKSDSVGLTNLQFLRVHVSDNYFCLAVVTFCRPGQMLQHSYAAVCAECRCMHIVVKASKW